MSLMLAITLGALALAVIVGVAWTYRRPHVRETAAEPPAQEVPDVMLPESVTPVAEKSESPEIAAAAEDSPEEPPKIAVTYVGIYANYLTLSEVSADTVNLLETLTEAIPNLPRVALDLLPVLARPGGGSKEIAQVIEQDQTIAARLLRWVNSSLFGLVDEVDSLQRAVTLLGIDAVRSLVLQNALERSVAPPSLHGLSQRLIWRHASAASVTARHLARSGHRIDPSVAATVGLLHDIGLLLLLTTERRKLDTALICSATTREPLIAHEDAAMGFNHQTWGQSFVRAWHLPEAIAHPIGSHHSPLRDPLDPLTCIIWLADYVISRIGFPCPQHEILEADPAEIATLLRIVGLRPPIDQYISQGLIREVVLATRLCGREPDEDEEGISSRTDGVITIRLGG